MVEFLHSSIPPLVWLVPLLPLAAGALISLLPDRLGRSAAALAIGAQAGAMLLALAAFALTVIPAGGEVFRHATSWTWFHAGASQVRVGLLLDPLSAGMAAMVTFVGLLIFIFSLGYMKHDPRFGRFFGLLALFSGAMLLAVYANSLLLLFVAWELVGLASYLLIGFYYPKPSAAAAAQKAFITTRVGDLGFFLGMIWLYAETGTLLFYDAGAGLLEVEALSSLAVITTAGGLSVSAAASLLLLCGAIGKSGQLPLHTWLPDAMEGPTPVSALIHAATMVAAGVFLVARVHPLFASAAAPGGLAAPLVITAWLGGATALYAALVAVAQTDIKRLLAYSTVSQLGFMMLALGTGGVGAAMVHLIAHAFFKALLFLSAGSIIHGCHGEQNMFRMGGLARKMPWTFGAYAVGMMALAGFPFLFSGFWTKEAILHSAQSWSGGPGPFLLAAAAALLTAFYMTRQILVVFFGPCVLPEEKDAHESPPVMLAPLYVLAAVAMLLSLVATPAWPWFENYLAGTSAALDPGALATPGFFGLVALSVGLLVAGAGTAWMLYRPKAATLAYDPLKLRFSALWRALNEGLYIDRFYSRFVAGGVAALGRMAESLESGVFERLLRSGEVRARRVGRFTSLTDENAFNAAFNGTCQALRNWGLAVSRAQTGRLQGYVRSIGLGMVALFLLYFWIAA